MIRLFDDKSTGVKFVDAVGETLKTRDTWKSAARCGKTIQIQFKNPLTRKINIFQVAKKLRARSNERSFV